MESRCVGPQRPWQSLDIGRITCAGMLRLEGGQRGSSELLGATAAVQGSEALSRALVGAGTVLGVCMDCQGGATVDIYRGEGARGSRMAPRLQPDQLSTVAINWNRKTGRR